MLDFNGKKVNNMRNLYELTNNFMELQQLIEDGEFDAETLADTLEALEGEIEVKAENYGLIMVNLQTLIDGCDREAKRLLDRKKSIQNGIEGLKNNLSNSMLAMDKTKFKTEHFNFSFRKSESVIVDDQSLIPDDYIKVKTTETADKTALKKAIKNGCEITGAHIVSKQNLQIK